MQTREGHPEVGSPKRIFLTMMKTMSAKAANNEKMPKRLANANGFVEKPMIPSME